MCMCIHFSQLMFHLSTWIRLRHQCAVQRFLKPKCVCSEPRAALTKMPQILGAKAIVIIWKPWISSLIWGMVTSSAPGNDWVPSQNIEVTWLRPAQLWKPQNDTKFNVVWNVSSKIYLKKMWISEIKWNYKRIGWSKPEKSKFEKVWFCFLAKQHYTVSWQKTRGCRTFCTVSWPFHRVEQAIIPHLKEGYLSCLLTKKNCIFQTNGYFLSIFLSCAGLMHVSSTFWAVTH